MRREQRTTTKSNPIAGRPSLCSLPRTVATTTLAAKHLTAPGLTGTVVKALRHIGRGTRPILHRRWNMTAPRDAGRYRCEALSGAAGMPSCNLLDKPRITVRIIEGEERPVARALGVGAGKPCLHRKRRAVPHPTRVDATPDEFGMSRFDVGDN